MLSRTLFGMSAFRLIWNSQRLTCNSITSDCALSRLCVVAYIRRPTTQGSCFWSVVGAFSQRLCDHLCFQRRTCGMQSGRMCKCAVVCYLNFLIPYTRLHHSTADKRIANGTPSVRCRSPKPKSAMATQCCPQSRLTQRNAVRRNVAKLTARSKPPVAVFHKKLLMDKTSLRFRPFLHLTGDAGGAIPNGVSFPVFLYFDKTACLSVLSVFRWVLSQGKGFIGAYRGFSKEIFWRQRSKLVGISKMLCGGRCAFVEVSLSISSSVLCLTHPCKSYESSDIVPRQMQ